MGSAGDMMTTATITFRKSDIIVAARDIQEPLWRVVTKHTALWTCMIHLRHSWHEEWVRTWGSVILLIWARARDLVVVTQTQVSVFKNLSKERQQLKQELSICGSTLCLPGICGQQPGFCNKTRVSVCSSTSPEIFPPDVKAWWSGRASEPLCLFFFFKIILLIYLFRLCWVFPAVWALSSSLAVRSEGYSLVQCMGFSLPWLVSLRSAGSMMCGLHGCGTQHGFSCFVTCGIFQDQGSNLCLLRWLADSLPLCHQGSLHLCVFLFTRHQVFLIYLNISFNNTCLL